MEGGWCGERGVCKVMCAHLCAAACCKSFAALYNHTDHQSELGLVYRRYVYTLMCKYLDGV